MQNIALESRINQLRHAQALAGRPEDRPGVRPTDLQGWVVAEDVVAEVLQWGLRVRCGELRRLLHLFTDGDVDFLSNQERETLHTFTFDSFCTFTRIRRSPSDQR